MLSYIRIWEKIVKFFLLHKLLFYIWYDLIEKLKLLNNIVVLSSPVLSKLMKLLVANVATNCTVGNTASFVPQALTGISTSLFLKSDAANKLFIWFGLLHIAE